jgi:hypothetical protein
MRIKIFSSFCDSELCKKRYEETCETYKIPTYGIGRDFSITTGEDYTHAIILNTAMPVLINIPKGNVIGLAFEPPAYLKLSNQFILYAQKNIGKYFIGDKMYWFNKNIQLPDIFVEHYAYMWHINPLRYIPIKNKMMSIMVSEKNQAPGHQYRHTLVQSILDDRLPIDIYGRGASAYSYYNESTNIKGIFNELEPYENYSFHICIENFSSNAYFSEKIVNTLLCGATPIYWGCNKVTEKFPGNVILLSGNIKYDMLLLRDIINNPEKYRRKINVEEVKKKLNIFRNLDKVFT